MLALGRCPGETMAVTFVIGNANRMPTSLFSPGTPLLPHWPMNSGEAAVFHLHLVCPRFLVVCHHLRGAFGGPRYSCLAERPKGSVGDAHGTAIPRFIKNGGANAVGLTLSGVHGLGLFVLL